MKTASQLLILALCILAATLSALTKNPTTDEVFQIANEAYDDGRFGDAVIAFEDILDDGVTTAGIYYNLGNAYYRLDNLPYAILNFERAKRLNPSDSDIKHNLALATAKTIDRIEPVPQFFLLEWYDEAINHVGSGFWAWIVIISLWLIAGSAYLLFLGGTKSRRKLGLITAAPLVILFLVSLVLAWQADYQENLQNKAIVMSPSAYVRSEPSESAAELFILHEGTKAEIIDLQGDFFHILLPDGNKGWIDQSQIEKI